MKRWLTKIVVFLLLGAIVNVAVAWASSVFIGLALTNSNTCAYRNSTVGNWNVETYKRFSAIQVISFRVRKPNYSEDSVGPLPEDLIPTWIGYDAELYENRSVEYWSAEARGWPVLVLWSKTIWLYKALDGTRQEQGISTEGAIELPLSPFAGPRGRILKVLPLRPIWPGFAINTIFYAAILWSLTLGPFTARRIIRRKRGHCIKCGYDLRGEFFAGCPECGWQRASKP